MVVSPEFDDRQPETVEVHELTQPRPSAVTEAHDVAAVGLVPGEFFPRVLRAASRLVEVVVDTELLVALDEEGVESWNPTQKPCLSASRMASANPFS
jgi:hypothetical protein